MASATRAATAFAARIGDLPAREAVAAAAADGSYAAGVLAREPERAAAVAAARWAAAGARAAELALAGELRAARRVAVVAGGEAAACVARALAAGPRGVVVVGGGVAALRRVGGRVEYCEVAGCAAAVAGCDAVVFGAEAVCADGSCVAGLGAGAVVGVARMGGVRCVAVVQSVKFGRDVFMAGAGRAGVEVVEGRFVDALWTEVGCVPAAEAAVVARRHGVA